MSRKPRAAGAPEAPAVPLLERDGLITPAELAEYLGVEVSTTDQWASRGGGPLYHKVGTHRRYHPEDVKAWLRDRRHAATGDPRPAA